MYTDERAEYSLELTAYIVGTQPFKELGFECEQNHGSGALSIEVEFGTIYATPYWEGICGACVQFANYEGDEIFSCDVKLPEPCGDEELDAANYVHAMKILLAGVKPFKKMFCITWGSGYPLNPDGSCNSEEHDLDWFCDENGIKPEDREAINQLCLAEALRLRDLHIVTVVRIK